VFGIRADVEDPILFDVHFETTGGFADSAEGDLRFDHEVSLGQRAATAATSADADEDELLLETEGSDARIASMFSVAGVRNLLCRKAARSSRKKLS
jgi:hypothetical protein